MDSNTDRVPRSSLTRRGFLGGIAATAGAAILAACGDASIATDTPRPAPTMTTGGAATVAPATIAATRPAATTAPPAAPTAAAAISGTTAATASGSGSAGTGTIVPIAPPPPDKFKGQKLAMISRQEYFSETQKTIDAELQMWAKQLGAEIETAHISTDDGVFVSKTDAAVKAGNPPDMQYLDRGISQYRQLGDIVEVSDVVEELQRAYGPVEDALRNEFFVDGK